MAHTGNKKRPRPADDMTVARGDVPAGGYPARGDILDPNTSRGVKFNNAATPHMGELKKKKKWHGGLP